MCFSNNQPALKEAAEVMEEPEGRWWTFHIQPTDFVILEKKTVPPHLASMESLDTPVTVTSLLSDLQDAGEVTRLYQTEPDQRH